MFGCFTLTHTQNKTCWCLLVLLDCRSYPNQRNLSRHADKRQCVLPISCQNIWELLFFIFALHVHLPKRPEVNNRSHLFFDILRACLTTREDRLNKSDPVVFIASSSTQQQDPKKNKTKTKESV
ncbi:hypothetical protein OUZ56_001361 [Daphnia magna]|uniref:Uncharacterized protein n=1 Tax=Daphnia magna TaxID=35525 RepID=A0ABR0A2F1_9CRUS|nr:hypothetical protein OUZ56_001361 [Daphnia magna]